MSKDLAIQSGKPSIDVKDHVKWPIITAEDKAAVMNVLDRGVLSGPFAPEVRALEQEFASWLGVKHCLTVNSGTAALHMAVAAAGIGAGDEIIQPAYSFVATAMSALQQSAIPVFVDIEPETYCIDPAKIEAAITPRTKAIMPVHIHGTPANLPAIMEIAKRHNLIVLEDAAQAHGAAIHGKKVGTFGLAGGFSLQSSKNLGVGEGGLFVTNDDEVLHRANRMRMFGEDVKMSDASGYKIERPLDSDRAYDSMSIGWMYRTNEMTAALSRTQFKRLDASNAMAARNAKILSDSLSKLPGIKVPQVPAGYTSCFHKFRVAFDATAVGVQTQPKVVRDALIRALRAEGVDAVMWQGQPIPGQHVFKERTGFGHGYPWAHTASDASATNIAHNYDLSRYPVTQRVLDSSLCLFSQTFPLYPQSETLVRAYADAFTRVWSRLEEVVRLAAR